MAARPPADEAAPDSDLRIHARLRIPGDELRETASRSRGPGGQHGDKASTRVTLRWRPAESAALSERQLERLLERLPLTRAGELVVHADAHRSRARNREAARGRLAEHVREALARQAPRRPTREPRGVRRREVEGKRKRGAVKRRRGPVTGDD